MGTGIVVREEAKPYLSSTHKIWAINNWSVGYDLNSRTKYRVKKFIDIYKNNNVDNWAYYDVDTTGGYGGAIAQIEDDRYDKTAAYSVTYLALDTYKLGIAPQSISGTVTPNIKETVDDAVQAITGLRRDVSVLQATKVGKQQPQWITATLINGWENYDIGNIDPVCYRITEAGNVMLKGTIRSGINGMAALILPKGMRPAKKLIRSGMSHAGSGSEVSGRIDVDSDGKIVPKEGSGGYISLEDVEFYAEQ
jgi:hypothetical protein